VELLIAFIITLIFSEVPLYRRVNNFRNFERLCFFHPLVQAVQTECSVCFFFRNVNHCVPKWHGLTSHGTWIFSNIVLKISNIAANSEMCHLRCVFKLLRIRWGRFNQKHNYKYVAKWWCLLAKENNMFRPVAAIIRFWQLSCYKSYIQGHRKRWTGFETAIT